MSNRKALYLFLMVFVSSMQSFELPPPGPQAISPAEVLQEKIRQLQARLARNQQEIKKFSSMQDGEKLMEAVVGSEEDGEPYYEEMEELLTNKNIDLNTRHFVFDNYLTPLMIAAWKNDEEAVKLLLEAGADVSIQDPDGNTALDYLVRDLVKNSDSVADCASPEFKAALGMLLAAGAGRMEEQQAHALMRVISIPKLRLLLEADFNPNAKLETGYTPLMHAAKYNQKEKAKALLEAYAYVNAADCAGNTALMEAASNRVGDDVAITIDLLEAGADPSKKNLLNEDAYYFASRNYYSGIRNFLNAALMSRGIKRKLD